MSKRANSFQQLKYLFFELQSTVNRKYWRWMTMWFGGSAGVILSYRLDRFFYLLLGNVWGMLRIFFYPVFLTLRLLSSNHGIHYKADIGKGLRILHPSLGIVVSGRTVAGENLILTGGNCLGGRKKMEEGDLMLGNNVFLGANAVVLGPVKIGNNVSVGAGAVVVQDAEDHCVLVGVPARVLRKGE